MLKLPKIRSSKYKEHLNKFIKRILKRSDVIGILVFGSIAKGKEKPFPESDIDILVIAKKLPKNIYERRMRNLKYKIGAESIEDIWLTPKELINGVKGGWGILLDALTDGIIIYDKEEILNTARKLVKEKFRRIGRIWILQ